VIPLFPCPVELALGSPASMVAACGAHPELSAPQEGPSPEIATPVVRLDSPQAQLARARGVRSSALRASGADRERLVARALEELHGLRLLFPDDRRSSAEAAHLAGSMLARVGKVAEALEELALARDLGRGSSLAARAELEIGRLERRRDRGEAALDAFFAAGSDPAASRSTSDEAWLEAAALWSESGCAGEARRAWRRVAERGADPVDRIRAFDRLGRAWIDAGDLEAACGVLDECLGAFAEAAAEDTERGARTRRALERMSLARELARRIDQRRARDIERGTRAGS
jgi:tetratricopeptide (TPR) repeat protein